MLINVNIVSNHSSSDLTTILRKAEILLDNSSRLAEGDRTKTISLIEFDEY